MRRWPRYQTVSPLQPRERTLKQGYVGKEKDRVKIFHLQYVPKAPLKEMDGSEVVGFL